MANFGFTQAPVYINWNRLSGNNSLNGITLSNVTGGVVNKNTISGFVNGINVITSSIDLFKNSIDFNQTSLISNLLISACGLVNMSTIDGNVLGGFNLFSNGGDNIISDNSFFVTDKGYNYFYTPDNTSLHFAGTFNNVYNVARDVQSTKNCFYVDNISPITITDVDWYQGDPVDFNFIPYECTQPEIESGELVEVSQYIIDTIWNISGGFGSGNMGSNKTAEITNVNVFKLKSDSLKVLMRKRKFNDVTRIGNELLNTYPDSAGIINIIQPVYFATLVTDDSINTKISNYKNKLESIISSNPEITSLVLRCNYFIQKCKVKLGQYQSALGGFQQIMQSFPYSWEGVVAGWDYSATQLLAGGGMGQGIKNSEHRVGSDHEFLELDELHKSDENKKYNEIVNTELGLDELKQIEAKKAENFDDKITKTVSNSLTESKINAEKELKKDEEKIIHSKKSINEKSPLTKSELQEIKKSEKNIEQKRVINEVIKTRKPETVIEQINFVNNDLKMIFSSMSPASDNNGMKTELPQEYILNQNYPNPFNPVTKISFSLPKEVKVTLVIYDILGREVAKLLNNELKPAGSYNYEFNGRNFASGIYFYSLITNDFKQTKKMLMIK